MILIFPISLLLCFHFFPVHYHFHQLIIAAVTQRILNFFLVHLHQQLRQLLLFLLFLLQAFLQFDLYFIYSHLYGLLKFLLCLIFIYHLSIVIDLYAVLLRQVSIEYDIFQHVRSLQVTRNLGELHPVRQIAHRVMYPSRQHYLLVIPPDQSFFLLHFYHHISYLRSLKLSKPEIVSPRISIVYQNSAHYQFDLNLFYFFVLNIIPKTEKPIVHRKYLGHVPNVSYCSIPLQMILLQHFCHNLQINLQLIKQSARIKIKRRVQLFYLVLFVIA